MTPTHLSMSHEGKETAKDWRCFHCDEVFHNADSAMEHFGRHELCEPGCQINLAKYREMEIYMERAAAEDTDKDRAYHAMVATYERRMIEEEEKGYARGLRDGRAYVAAVEKERDELRAALEPFANAAESMTRFSDDAGVDLNVYSHPDPKPLTLVVDFRRARAALKVGDA